jgi:uncharacterized protein (DUF433 family)
MECILRKKVYSKSYEDEIIRNKNFRSHMIIDIRKKYDIRDKKFGIFMGENGYNDYYNNMNGDRYMVNGNKYLKLIKEKHKGIDMSIRKMSGMPTIKGTRIPVSLIVSCLRDKLGYDDIKKNYYLSDEQIKESLDYVMDVLDSPYMEE